jgi:transcriptional regulator with XRE-family HTH domain
MGATYPDLGKLQPKNLWGTNYQKFGSFTGMEKLNPKAIGTRIRARRNDLGLSQPQLAAEMKKAGYTRGFSQQNILTLEKGGIQDPRRQVMDLAVVLRTTSDWILYEKGQKEIWPRLMTAEEYQELPLELREEMTVLALRRRALAKSA